MSLPDPTSILPHRDPFLFVSRIVELEPGVRAVCEWDLADQDFFRGHFPGRPTLPGVLQIEALAQCAGIATSGDERFVGKLLLFGGIDKARFRRQVVPGDTLRLEAELGRMSARAGKGSGTASVNGEVACQADMLFVVAPADADADAE